MTLPVQSSLPRAVRFQQALPAATSGPKVQVNTAWRVHVVGSTRWYRTAPYGLNPVTTPGSPIATTRLPSRQPTGHSTTELELKTTVRWPPLRSSAYRARLNGAPPGSVA